jgi:16S rRNA (cytosine967-C5)-methyltransferase
MQPRLIAAKALQNVLTGGSLSRELPRALQDCPAESRATVQALVYGALRYFERIDFILQKLLRKPLKKRDRIVADLLRIALFELLEAVTPDYAVVNGTVKSVAGERPWARGLANAVLRRFIRERPALMQTVATDEVATAMLPQWLLEKIKVAYPQRWESLAVSLNQPAPMTLRIDLARTSRDGYLQRLLDAGIDANPVASLESAVTLLHPTDITELPEFAEGWVAVQDAAAQHAAFLLDAQSADRVLDACAAPGGKTVHILERAAGNLHLTAVESAANRVRRLEENLERSGYSAEIIVADVAETASWWDGQLFDRILLDVPCSAIGVIRRHPDIKRHRRAEDIATLVAKQARLLKSVWGMLRPGGRLLYATCSILPEENSDQIERFLNDHADAKALPSSDDWGLACRYGRQILPGGEENMDGFYYASVVKK